MFKFVRDVITILCVGACAAVLLSGQPASAADAVAGAADDRLYRALGEKPGIAALMQDFAARLKTDPRMAPFFKNSKEPLIASQLTDQLCGLAGGPCIYDGATMKDAHSGLGIARADFNALVDVLQEVMDARQVPSATQDQLLARLLPMHRDIVTK